MGYALMGNPHKHYYPTRNKRIRLIGLHVTAGLQDLDMKGEDHSARGTNRYGATTSTQASWHCCVDSDSIEDALPDSYTAFHIKGYNSESLGLEISNKDAIWSNKPAAWVEATLLNAARKCLDWERKHNIPRVLLTKQDVDAGKWGYTYHMFLDPKRRRDPGKDFPIERFFEMIDALDKGQNLSVPNGGFEEEYIKSIQNLLNNFDYNLAVDGRLGPRTTAAVKDFQLKNRLQVDGRPGPATIAKLTKIIEEDVLMAVTEKQFNDLVAMTSRNNLILERLLREEMGDEVVQGTIRSSEKGHVVRVFNKEQRLSRTQMLKAVLTESTLGLPERTEGEKKKDDTVLGHAATAAGLSRQILNEVRKK